MSVVAYIGLGSNLEDPVRQVETALDELDAIAESRLLAASPLYRSAPMGPTEQPDYINAVAALETGLEPEALLDALQAIERRHKRVRKEHWGPRTLDLDLLLYGSQTLCSARLTVPHPGLRERAFVIYPLADIAPEAQLPDGTRVNWLRDHCPFDGLERLTPPRLA